MFKLRLIPGLFAATRLIHWPELAWYLVATAFARAFGVHGECIVTFRPFRVALDLAGRSGLFFLHEVVTSNIYDLTPGRDESVRVIFDAGANCGFFTLRHACANDGVKVVSFEPHPTTFHRLERNITVNGLQHRVIAVHAAVGAQKGTCEIATSEESSMAVVASSPVQFLQAPVKTTVPLITLDDWAAQQNLWPDYIKIDVEGFEVEVLRGAKECLKNAKWVVLEYHSDHLRSECVRLLNDSSYEVELVGHSLLQGHKSATSRSAPSNGASNSAAARL